MWQNGETLENKADAYAGQGQRFSRIILVEFLIGD
jgi:hypothetical protein